MESKQIETLVREALGDYLSGSNATKIKKALDRLKRDKGSDEKAQQEPSKVSDEDIISSVPEEQKEKIEAAHAINFLNQDVKYGSLRRNIVSMLKIQLKRGLDNMGRLDNLETDTMRKRVAKETSNKIIDAVEKAVQASLPMSAAQFVTMKEGLQKEVMSLCEFESKKHLKECACQDFDKPKKVIHIRIVK